MEKLQGLWMARAIHVPAQLGLPDLLAGRAKSLSERGPHRTTPPLPAPTSGSGVDSAINDGR